MKLSFVTVLILFLSFPFLFSCIEKRDNAETTNLKFYVMSGLSTPGYCFDNIKGIGRPSISKLCSKDSIDFIELPLNIAMDSSTFVFTKDKASDTIVIAYSREIEMDGSNYKSKLFNLRISRYTFGNLKCPCLPKSGVNVIFCNDQQFKAYITL
jgi:hypothetical protein